MVEILEIAPDQLNSDTCVICLSNKKEIVFYPCGHQCLCLDCSKRFQDQARHMICPICRNRIKDMIKVYK